MAMTLGNQQEVDSLCNGKFKSFDAQMQTCKLISHIFPVLLTWIFIIVTISDYFYKFKDCDFPEISAS